MAGIAVAAAVLFLIAVGLFYRVVHVAMMHPGHYELMGLLVLGACAAACGLIYAVIRGASRHVVIAYSPREVTAGQMPAPRELPSAGPQAVLVAERDDEPDPEPEPVKPSMPCDNESGRQLGDALFMVEVVPDGAPDDYEGEKHLFCSQACLEEWQEADIARRAAL